MASKKISKRKALSLLRKYFQTSERHYKIGNGETEKDLSYEDKVLEMNICFNVLRQISEELKEFNLYSI